MDALARGPLYELVRERLGISLDLDLCARIYGVDANTRSAFAQFAPLVHDAAKAGDAQAIAIFSAPRKSWSNVCSPSSRVARSGRCRAAGIAYGWCVRMARR